MWAVIVLAGGRGRRLGNVDKPGLVLAGRSLLDRVLDAVPDADRIVVVGPSRRTARPVSWTTEQPPGGGPVAAVAAGLAGLGAEYTEIVLLAADLIGLRADTVSRLRESLGTTAGVVLRDADGRRQWLTSAWQADALRAALPAQPAGLALRSVLGSLTVAELVARPGESADIDTPDDLVRAQRPESPPDPAAGAGPSRPSHW